MAQKVIMTTTSSLEGWEVLEYFGPVSAQFVIGTGLLTDFFSGWTDFFGAHSRSYQNKLDKIDREALDLIREKAFRVGGNAVLGLRVDHDEISGAGKSMLMVTASGTAARVRPIPAAAIRSGSPAAAGGVTAQDVRNSLRRQSLMQLARANRVDWNAESTWGFILENEVAELVPHYLDHVQKMLPSYVTPDESKRIESRFEELMLMLPHEAALPVLYECCKRHRVIYNLALRTVHSIDGFDVERTLALLSDGQDLAARRVVGMATADKPIYEASDLLGLGQVLAGIESLFQLAPLREVKGILGKKTLWTCRCGKDVEAEQVECSACGLNRWGFEAGLTTPGEAQDVLSRKIDLLRTRFVEEMSVSILGEESPTAVEGRITVR